MSEYQELQRAIIKDDFDFFKSILNNVNDVNARCQTTKNNILNYYVYALGGKKINYKILDLMISKGVDINSCDYELLTPLHGGVMHKQVDAVKYLLQHGAKVDAKQKHGNTPLWLAVMHFRGEESMLNIIKMLIEFEANPDEPNNYDITPRSIVLDRHKHMEIVGTPIEWDLQPHLNW